MSEVSWRLRIPVSYSFQCCLIPRPSLVTCLSLTMMDQLTISIKVLLSVVRKVDREGKCGMKLNKSHKLLDVGVWG